MRCAIWTIFSKKTEKEKGRKKNNDLERFFQSSRLKMIQRKFVLKLLVYSFAIHRIKLIRIRSSIFSCLIILYSLPIVFLNSSHSLIFPRFKPKNFSINALRTNVSRNWKDVMKIFFIYSPVCYKYIQKNSKRHPLRFQIAYHIFYTFALPFTTNFIF